MKKQLCFMISVMCFSIYAVDNSTLFNNAYQVGKQNQFNLNLNSNSSFTSYGQANSFESSLSTSANQGNANAKTMYDNTYGDNADPNYLYKSGVNEIQRCQNSNDPRCTTLNKYGDKDTQTQLQAYNTGVSQKYYMNVRPDPADSSCSYITKKVPISSTQPTCISDNKQSGKCYNVITPSFSMRCSSGQSITDRVLRSADPTGRCDYLTVKLSCDGGGNYQVFLGVEDCSHSGYSASATKTFAAQPNAQNTDTLTLRPTWSNNSDGCANNPIDLTYNYICPVTGDCLITFGARCANNPYIYNKTFSYSSLTTKTYNYNFSKGCPNE